jgi:hypothetical protein
MSPRISVLCPTRSRPGNVRRLVTTGLETAAGGIEFVFYADDDAPGSVPEDVAGMAQVTVVTGPRIVMSDMWNACWKASGGEILMQCGDDIAFRTPGWDSMVCDVIGSYPDRIVFAYGQDGLRDDDYGTHGFVHRAWAETLGYFTPPWFSCDYSDTWLNEVAAMAGRKHQIPGLLTEHCHPNAGKHPWDQVHQERAARGARDNVAGLYESMAPRREQDAAKLRAVMT